MNAFNAADDLECFNCYKCRAKTTWHLCLLTELMNVFKSMHKRNCAWCANYDRWQPNIQDRKDGQHKHVRQRRKTSVIAACAHSHHAIHWNAYKNINMKTKNGLHMENVQNIPNIPHNWLDMSLMLIASVHFIPVNAITSCKCQYCVRRARNSLSFSVPNSIHTKNPPKRHLRNVNMAGLLATYWQFQLIADLFDSLWKISLVAIKLLSNQLQ